MVEVAQGIRGRTEFVIASPITSLFPFKPIDQTDRAIAEKIAVPSVSISDLQGLIGLNRMFAVGSDHYIPARAAYLGTLVHEDKPAAIEVANAWNLDLETVSDSFSVIDQLIAKPHLTVDEVEAFTHYVYPIEAYMLRELHLINSGKNPVDPQRIQKLAKIAQLFYMSATDNWQDSISHHALTEAMSICLQDVVFWHRYPHLFDLVSKTIAQTTRVEPAMAYNYELQSSILEKQLVKGKLISGKDLAQKKIRVIGNQKPANSAIADDMAEGILDGTMTLPQIEQALSQGDRNFAVNFVHELLKRRFKGYDQRRGRIQVSDPEVFNRIVRKMHNQLIDMRLAELLVDVLRKMKIVGTEKFFNLEDYFRLSRYNGTTSQRDKIQFHEYLREIPSQIVLDHYLGLENDEVGYAAYHAKKPHVQKRPLNFELQVILGTVGIAKMNQIAQVVLSNNGSFTEAGLTKDFIDVANRLSKQDASSLLTLR